MQLKSKQFKLLALASHPIQYQAPFFRRIAQCDDIDLTVLFCSRWGLENYYDKDFKQKIKWDIPLLQGYEYKFLSNWNKNPDPSKYWGLINLEVLDHLDKEKYDAVWIHGWNSFTNWMVLMSGGLKNVPIMLRCETNLLNPMPRTKAFFKIAVLQNLFKRVSCFLPIGAYNTEFYEAYGVTKEKMFLVPYMVDNEFFFSKEKECFAKRELTKRSYNIPSKLPVILFSGKLTEVKCPMDLLKAFEIASKKTPAALVFVGDGPLKAKMQRYVEVNKLQNVHFLGFKNQTELPEIYSISDVFVLPSRFEPWGLVVNEAMCFGKPVIVSDKVGAGGDLVKGGDNGLIYKAQNVQLLAESLEELLSNDAMRQRMGSRSREIISEWSFDKGVHGLLNAMQCIKGV